MKKYDVIIIGAGAAGLCAARAALKNGRNVLVLEMGDTPARKVSVSGGGRCNFTNLGATHERYFGENPDFVRSAFARVKPTDILDWVASHGLEWNEKEPGQYFCSSGATDIVNALLKDALGADIIYNAQVTNIEKSEDAFEVTGESFQYKSDSLIIATGGLSFPNLGVSEFGYQFAKKMGHKIVPPVPALVGLKTNLFPHEFSGMSLDVEITVGNKKIKDSLLFTHFGIGGPASYRASVYDLNQDFIINFAPGINIFDYLKNAKTISGKRSLKNLLSFCIPERIAMWFTENNDGNIADFSDKELLEISGYINAFKIPKGELKRRGFDTAEVTMGGISTDKISSKTMESKLISKLFFAGEVIDITGDLGGFNLHFAFASGIIAGLNA